MPLLALRKLVSDFGDAVDQRKTKEGLMLVNKLKHTPVDGEVAWFLRNAVGGLSPLVSPVQNSPMMDQATYRELKAGSIVTRHVKRFTDKELRNIMSPDDRFRIDQKMHLIREMMDMERRIFETQEFVAWSALARGSVKYVNNTDPANRVVVDVSFPITLETAGATWENIATDIKTDIDNTIEKFEYMFGKKPDAIRMTNKQWKNVKKNTSILNLFTSWLRTGGARPSDIARGVITPEFVAKAGDWPVIEIINHRTMVSYPCTNAESAGADQVVELTGGTWGINVGDEALCDYKIGTDIYDFKATVTAVVDGVSITITIPAGESLTAAELIVVKPTFFPEQKVQYIADENKSEFLKTPFGIDYSGSTITAGKFRGPHFDTFMSGKEPNLAVFRRAWDEFGMAMGSKVISAQVIV